MSAPTTPRPRSLRQRIVSGASWQVGLTLLGRVFTFALNAFQGRYLGVAAYGQLSLVQNTLQILTLFAGAATGSTITKYLSELRVSQPARVERILGFSIAVVAICSLIAGALLALFATPIAVHVLHQPEMAALLRLSSIALVALCLCGAFSGVLFGFQMFRAESIIRFVQAFAWFAFCVSLMITAGLWGAVLAYDLAIALSMALLCWFAFRALKSHGLKVDFRNALSERGVFKAYSLAVMLTTVVTVGSQYVIFALLSRSTEGAEATGRFMAAFQYRLVIQYVPMMIQATTGPIIAELLGAGQRDRAGRLFYQILGVVSLGLSVLSLVLVEFSSQLLGLFGKGFQASPLLFASVMAYAATVAGNNLASTALQMHGKPWMAFRADILAALVLVISGSLLINRYEDVGAALALLIAAIAQSAFYMISTRDVGQQTRRSIGGLRYAALIMLAPQLCLLPAFASKGARGPAFFLASAAAVGIVIWSGAGWYRRVRASTDPAA